MTTTTLRPVGRLIDHPATIASALRRVTDAIAPDSGAPRAPLRAANRPAVHPADRAALVALADLLPDGPATGMDDAAVLRRLISALEGAR